jgi:hypothetical protein
LPQKLNQSCFENFGVNVYKFISTSQLTYAVWVNWYWNETAKVFDSYIEFLYQFKKNAKKGTAQYTLAKLMMNGLYGKTIQKPILDENKIVWLREEFIKYHIKYGGVILNSLSDGSFYLTYQDDDKLKDKITKPVYLGNFILGYSRRIMFDYIKRATHTLIA